MSDESDPRRDALHDFLQHQGPPGQDDELDGALLTGWGIVLEWVSAAGDRWLSRGYATTTSLWGAKGMWHEALHGVWPGDDGGEDAADDE